MGCLDGRTKTDVRRNVEGSIRFGEGYVTSLSEGGSVRPRCRTGGFAVSLRGKVNPGTNVNSKNAELQILCDQKKKHKTTECFQVKESCVIQKDEGFSNGSSAWFIIVDQKGWIDFGYPKRRKRKKKRVSIGARDLGRRRQWTPITRKGDVLGEDAQVPNWFCKSGEGTASDRRSSLQTQTS